MQRDSHLLPQNLKIREDDSYTNISHAKLQNSVTDLDETSQSNATSFAEIFRRHKEMSDAGDDVATVKAVTGRLGFLFKLECQLLWF